VSPRWRMLVTRTAVRYLARAGALALALVTAVPLAAQRAIVAPTNFLTVTRGSSALLVNPTAFERYAIGEPEIAQAVVVSPSELLINGKSVGSTSLVLWDKAGEPRLYSIFSPLELLVLGVGEVAEHDLLGQGQRPLQPFADHLEALPGGVVDRLDELGGGFDG